MKPRTSSQQTLTTAYTPYKAALENAGAAPDMSAEDLCDKMVEQFTSMTFDGLTGTGATWSAEGAVTKDPTVVVIKDGKYVNV